MVRRTPREGGDIEACIAQAVHEVTPVLESKHIQLRLQVDRPSNPLCFDDMQIEQVDDQRAHLVRLLGCR